MNHTLRSDAFLCDAMERFGDAVFRLAMCQLRSHADAEDVFQEVFLRLLRDTTDFTSGGHLKAWLLRVTLSRCRDLRRSAWFKRTAPLEGLPEAAMPENDACAELWNAVAALPDDLRAPVYLHYVEGYTTGEIAGMIGCCAATVRTRLYRARKHLKLELEGNDDEQPERFSEAAGRKGAF